MSFPVLEKKNDRKLGSSVRECACDCLYVFVRGEDCIYSRGESVPFLYLFTHLCVHVTHSLMQAFISFIHSFLESDMKYPITL